MATYQDLPRTQRVLEHLEADSKSLAIIVAMTDQALAARAAVLDAADQAHIATATWGLELWEDLVGIVPETGATDADRRKAITAKLLGAGTCNAGMISDIAKALTGCDAVVIEQFSTYQFSLQFIGDEPGLAQFDLDAIRAAVEEVKPAHLEFIILGITWADFHLVQMTWHDLHQMQATWYDIHNKVMIQPRE